ncbi:MAG: hypothetical protein EOM58_00480 [Clostridia bacterium]|nr:hypothetical protein [Clostridia bacterium]
MGERHEQTSQTRFEFWQHIRAAADCCCHLRHLLLFNNGGQRQPCRCDEYPPDHQRGRTCPPDHS